MIFNYTYMDPKMCAIANAITNFAKLRLAIKYCYMVDDVLTVFIQALTYLAWMDVWNNQTLRHLMRGSLWL